MWGEVVARLGRTPTAPPLCCGYTGRNGNRNLYLKDRKPEDAPQWTAFFDWRLAIIDEMCRAGVPIMTGTDTGTPALVSDSPCTTS
jgi:hypothetical protein